MDAFISLKMKFLLRLCETDASVNSINFFIYQRQTSCFTDPVCPAGRFIFMSCDHRQKHFRAGNTCAGERATPGGCVREDRKRYRRKTSFRGEDCCRETPTTRSDAAHRWEA